MLTILCHPVTWVSVATSDPSAASYLAFPQLIPAGRPYWGRVGPRRVSPSWPPMCLQVWIGETPARSPLTAGGNRFSSNNFKFFW